MWMSLHCGQANSMTTQRNAFIVIDYSKEKFLCSNMARNLIGTYPETISPL